MDPISILYSLIGITVLFLIAAPFIWLAVVAGRGIVRSASKPLHTPKRSYSRR